jgi:hypothetical protein
MVEKSCTWDGRKPGIMGCLPPFEKLVQDFATIHRISMISLCLEQQNVNQKS